MKNMLLKLVSDSKGAKAARILLYILLVVMGIDLFAKIAPYVFYIQQLGIFGSVWEDFLSFFHTTPLLFAFTIIELLVWTALFGGLAFGFAYYGKYVFAVGIKSKRFPRRYIAISIIEGIMLALIGTFAECVLFGQIFYINLENLIGAGIKLLFHFLFGGGGFFGVLIGAYYFAEWRRKSTGYYNE